MLVETLQTAKTTKRISLRMAEKQPSFRKSPRKSERANRVDLPVTAEPNSTKANLRLKDCQNGIVFFARRHTPHVGRQKSSLLINWKWISVDANESEVQIDFEDIKLHTNSEIRCMVNDNRSMPTSTSESFVKSPLSIEAVK
jgi:hypothetical protein